MEMTKLKKKKKQTKSNNDDKCKFVFSSSSD